MAGTVKVRLRGRRAGPDGSAPPGAIIEVSAAVAKQLVETNQADRVAEAVVVPEQVRDAAPEAATQPQPETAASTNRAKRKAAGDQRGGE